MTKKITVNNCFDCPYSENQFKQGRLRLFCMNPETKMYEIHNQDRIEGFCELEQED